MSYYSRVKYAVIKISGCSNIASPPLRPPQRVPGKEFPDSEKHLLEIKFDKAQMRNVEGMSIKVIRRLDNGIRHLLV